jgi:signal transduction histidine kinase
MINVLVNAAKYSPQGGDIEVSVRHVQDEDELVAILGEVSSVKLPCLIVAVRDSGVGIPEDELGRVFEKFYRVDNRLTRATSGAGLGLHICKLIVEAHGGHIWAKSKVGEGSTLSFSLPTEKPTRQRRE